MIRFAERKDTHELLRMAKEFHSASPYSGLHFNEIKCIDLLEKYFQGNKTEIAILVSDVDGVQGMIIGLRGELPFSSEAVCTELAWWVSPESRGTRESLMLFKAYEEWTRVVKSKITQVAMLDDVTDLSEFYTRQGYRPAEKSYIKDI